MLKVAFLLLKVNIQEGLLLNKLLFPLFVIKLLSEPWIICYTTI